MENKSLKIGILGLGLIGGSILKSLHSLGFNLTAISNSSYEKAKKFANVSTNDILALKDCNIIFVCSKMSETKDLLDKLENIVSENTIVTDVCSIKGFITKKYKFNYIQGHPMAGTEFSGFENSFKELFLGAKWVLNKKNDTLEDLIKKMGAKPLYLNSKEHDSFTAQISHLPMLISTALFDAADEEAKIIASSGFRDTTRLCMTNPDLAYDMLNLNRENILMAYQKLIQSFEKLKTLKEDDFKEFMFDIAQKRCKMYDENGKNKL